MKSHFSPNQFVESLASNSQGNLEWGIVTKPTKTQLSGNALVEQYDYMIQRQQTAYLVELGSYRKCAQIIQSDGRGIKKNTGKLIYFDFFRLELTDFCAESGVKLPKIRIHMIAESNDESFQTLNAIYRKDHVHVGPFSLRYSLESHIPSDCLTEYPQLVQTAPRRSLYAKFVERIFPLKNERTY